MVNKCEIWPQFSTSSPTSNSRFEMEQGIAEVFFKPCTGTYRF